MSKLSIKDTMHFGKNQGMNVGKMIVEDAGYCCWLREECKRSDPRNLTFDSEANGVIDAALNMSSSLRRKYKQWGVPLTVMATVGAPIDTTVAVSKTVTSDLINNQFAMMAQHAKLKMEESANRAKAIKDEEELNAFVAETTSKTAAYADSWGAW